MIELPYPAPPLWPNKPAHWAVKAREAKKHKAWAYAAMLADLTRPAAPTRLIVTISPKERGPVPDKDNAVAALKHYIDGIAQACGVNDRTFEAPVIHFSERTKYGAVSIVLEA